MNEWMNQTNKNLELEILHWKCLQSEGERIICALSLCQWHIFYPLNICLINGELWSTNGFKSQKQHAEAWTVSSFRYNLNQLQMYIHYKHWGQVRVYIRKNLGLSVSWSIRFPKQLWLQEVTKLQSMKQNKQINDLSPP